MATEPEILPAHVHRALLYIETLNSAGYSPSLLEVEQYAMSSGPRDAVYQSAFDRMGIGAMMQIAMGQDARKVRDAEPVVDYLLRMGWVAAVKARLRLTNLGSSLLAGLRADGKTRPVGRVDDVSVTVLDPDDPFVYEAATRRIAEAGDGILVDPYFKAGSLSWLLNATNITRLLVGHSKPVQKGELELIRLALHGIETAGEPRKIEIRATTSKALHDRCIVPDAGVTLLLGTSVTGIGHHLSSILPMPEKASTPYRAHIRKIWAAAGRVESAAIVGP